MSNVILPKSMRDEEFYLAGALLSVVEATPEDFFEFENEEKEPNIHTAGVSELLASKLSPEARRVLHMHMKYNVCESLIHESSTKTIFEKIAEIASVMKVRTAGVSAG